MFMSKSYLLEGELEIHDGWEKWGNYNISEIYKALEIFKSLTYMWVIIDGWVDEKKNNLVEEALEDVIKKIDRSM